MTRFPPVHFKEADGIRGLACMLVLIVHVLALTYPAAYAYFYGTAKIGVWLFFSLSSFLLTYQFLIRGLSTKTLIDYFLGRILRIYPLFALSVLIYYYAGYADINTFADVIAALTFKQGFAHLWTIPVEFKFYFILPVFVWLGNLLHGRYGLIGLLSAGLGFTLIHQFFAPYWLVPPNTLKTFPYLPAFLFGCLGAFIKYHAPNNWLTSRSSLIGGSILAGIFLSTPWMINILLGLPPTGYLLNKFLFFSLAWTIFIIATTNSNGILSVILSSRTLGQIGIYSYSIYLVHWLVLHTLIEYYPEQVITVFAAIMGSISLGFLMYVFLEKPLLKLRTFLRARITVLR